MRREPPTWTRRPPACGATSEAARYLRRHAEDSGLRGAALDAILGQVQYAKYPARDAIVEPGVASGLVGVVCSGAIEIVSRWPGEPSTAGGRARYLTVDLVGRGGIFGVLPPPRGRLANSFGVVAHVRTAVAFFAPAVVASLLGQTSDRLGFLARHVRALLRRLETRCQLLGLDVRERILQELSRLARVFPTRGADPGGIDLTLTHEDIARLVGARRVQVSRAIGALTAAGSLQRDGSQRYAVVGTPAQGAPPACAPRAGDGRWCDDSARRRLARCLQDSLEAAGLSRAASQRFCSVAALRLFHEGDSVASDPGAFATMVVSGSVRVVLPGADDDLGAWIARPGHFLSCGWGSSTALAAIAHEECEVAILSRDAMQSVLGAMRDGDEVLSFLNYLDDDLLRQIYDVSVILPLKTVERVYYRLRSLAHDFPAAHPEGTVVDLELLPASAILAQFVGVRGRAVRDALDALVDGGQVRILKDPDRLLLLGYKVGASGL